jgi:hypothetical protein
MVDHVGGVDPLAGSGKNRKLKPIFQNGQAPRGPDGVDLSSDLARLKQIKGIRLEKVLEARKALHDGTMVTDQKLDVALDRALDDLQDRLGI